jgi:hypothetical protein
MSVIEDSPVVWRMLFQYEADDDNVNMGFATSLASPRECAVRESNFETIALEENRLELGDLFPLGD